MKTLNYIEVQQPIGTFYLCAIQAMDLLSIVDVSQRTPDNETGIQRERSKSRIVEIGKYCSDPDAVFPTPIVVSVRNQDDVVLDANNHTISYEENKIIGNVLDGQHRLWGIENSEYRDKFVLPVVFMFGLTIEEEAYIFATINSNQTKVSVSLIYDLFENSKYHSPQKTAHYIARVMNSQEDSPFYGRLKMLGKKEEGQVNATLSQGTFATAVLSLISKKPKEDMIKVKRNEPLDRDTSLPFRDYYIEEKDTVIAKILYNCFTALKNTFPEEWNHPNENILWKTTGFLGIMKAMPQLCEKGRRMKALDEKFFALCFEALKVKLEANHITLRSDSFPGGSAQVQARFAEVLISSLDAIRDI